MTHLRNCLALLFFIGCSAHGETLELTTLSESGDLLPCRVLVHDASGNCTIPEGAVTLEIDRERWFMSSGKCSLEVPEETIVVRIERGPEYVRVKQKVRIKGTTSKTWTLRRWINMSQRGYRCGENHLHLDTSKLAPMLAAEGLDFGTSLTWWRGPDPDRLAPEGKGQVRILEFAGHRVPTSVFDAELEYAWGAAYIQNLPTAMPIRAEEGRPNYSYLQHATEAGAIVHYQGGWSREVLLDALMGWVHTVNICNNNFALHRFQPRTRYSNLLQVNGFPVYADNDMAMMRMNTDTYYRLLNCGLKLAAGAGSATGVKQAPAGYNRAYVRLKKGASLDDFYKAWKTGKNFVTNGPMLFLKAGSEQLPGDTIALPKGGGKITVHVDAVSDQPLTNVEIIINGNVAASLRIDNARHVTGTKTLQIEDGSWITARCTVRDDWLSDEELAVYNRQAKHIRYPIASSRLRFAHTSPIYVSVGGQGVAVRQSILEGLHMLDRLKRFSATEADTLYQPAMTAMIEKARLKLQNRLVE